MIRLLVIFLVAVASPAVAAPAPFVSYHSPARMCDVLPVTQQCRNAEITQWRKFLTGQLAPHFPKLTKVRLADLFGRDDSVSYGWVFKIIAPTAPARWRKLVITVGGVEVGKITPATPDARYENFNSLVVWAAIHKRDLAPGTHRVVAMDGTKEVFAFDLELEDSSAPPPLDPKQLAADFAAASQRPPFLLASLPTKPACTAQPGPAGCYQSIQRMWIDAFTNKLVSNPHTTRFAKLMRQDVFNNPMPHWAFRLIFPTAPERWLDADLEVQLDGKRVPYSHRFHVVGTEAAQVEIIVLEREVAAGKHTLRALAPKTGKTLFSSEIELEK